MKLTKISALRDPTIKENTFQFLEKFGRATGERKSVKVDNNTYNLPVRDGQGIGEAQVRALIQYKPLVTDDTIDTTTGKVAIVDGVPQFGDIAETKELRAKLEIIATKYPHLASAIEKILSKSILSTLLSLAIQDEEIRRYNGVLVEQAEFVWGKESGEFIPAKREKVKDTPAPTATEESETF